MLITKPASTFACFTVLHIVFLNLLWSGHLYANDTPINDKNAALIKQIDSLNDLSRQLTFINPSESLALAQSALAISDDYKKGKAYAYRNIANINVLNEVYNLGAQYINMASDIFIEINDSIGLADCYISYGHMYSGLQDFSNQISYLKKAYSIYKSRNFPDRLGVCAFNLAESYFCNKQYPECREHIKEALALNTITNQSQLLSACYELLGKLELLDGKTETAADYFNKVLDLSYDLGENSQKIATIESLVHLSELFKEKPNHQKQKEYLTWALNYAVQNGLSPYIISTYNKLILYHLNSNEVEIARHLLLELNAKSDSINKNRMKDQAELVNSLINTFNLEKENKYLELTNQLHEKNLRLIKISMIIILLITLISVIISANLNRTKIKVNQQNQELQQRNELITLQKNKLDELLVNRDKLLSIIAHDLRNPFNSMLLNLEIMSMEMEIKDYSSFSSDLSRLTSTARSTYELLEKLLLWAKNQKENIQPEKIDMILFKEVDEALMSLKGLAHDKNIAVLNQVADNILVYADKNMLHTILRNLIQNAIKFTRSGGEILIEAVVHDDMVETKIKDNGVGMDQITAQHLFEIDKSKIRNGTAGETGSGLGLALCLQFVEKNDGRIWAESERDKGTTISFTLATPVINH